MYSRKYDILIPVVLVVATLAVHGWALSDGLFLDDHWHRTQLETDQWSLQSLLDATTIRPDRFIDSWWQDKPVQWQYLRPVAVLTAKLVYHLSGSSVKALHGLSILLHMLGAYLVYRLCLLMTHKRSWSAVGMLLFVVYSHSVYAVAWLAAQNTVLQTVLMLGALLCYVRASALDIYAWPGGQGRSLEAAPRMNRAWATACLVLWLLALGCRENAVVMPVLTAGFELAFGGRDRLRTRWAFHVGLAVIAAAFVVWRLAFFYHPMPEFYVRRPDGPGYIVWWVVKLMHYLTSVVWLSPMAVGPTGRYDPVAEAPGDCLLMLLILLVLGTGYVQATRGLRGWWLWPLWLVLSLLPVVPVLATPHSGYMPSVAFSVALVLGAAFRDRREPIGLGRYCRPVAIWFLIATCLYVPIYRSFWDSVRAAENWTVAEVADDPPPTEARELFFVNLPFVNIYIGLHLQEALADGNTFFMAAASGPRRCHVLTFGQNVMRTTGACEVRQLDTHSFSVSIEGEPYFSGALGRFLIEAMRQGGRLEVGEVIDHGPFVVEIVRADESGVRELVYRFAEPLTSGKYCFYLTTQSRAAARLRFWGPPGPQDPPLGPVAVGRDEVKGAIARLHRGEAAAAETLFGAMLGQDRGLADEAWLGFRDIAEEVTRSAGSPVQGLLWRETPLENEVRRIARWWGRHVNDASLRHLWCRRDAFADYRQTRDRLFWIRRVFSTVIRTDLYQTGPPYPGPR